MPLPCGKILDFLFLEILVLLKCINYYPEAVQRYSNSLNCLLIVERHVMMKL